MWLLNRRSMLKYIFPFVLFFFQSRESSAQNRTNIWMIGYNFTNTYPDLGFDFSSDTLSMFNLERPMGCFLQMRAFVIQWRFRIT